MDENKRLRIAVAAPVAMMLGGLVGAAATNDSQPAAVVAEDEQLDPETERILYPYRVAQREKILYPYRQPRKPSPKPETKEVADVPAEAPAEEVADLTVPPAPKIEDEAPTLKEELDLVEEDEAPSAIDTFLALEDEAPTDGELSPATTPELNPTPDALAANDPAPAAPPSEPTAISRTSAASTGDEPPATLPLSIDPPSNTTVSTDPDPASAPPVESTAAADTTTALSAANALPVVEATPAVVEAPPEVVQVAAESVADPAPATAPSVTSSKPAPPPSSTAATPLAKKPFLGVGIRDVAGTTVTTVYPNSTAQKLGVKLGDRVVSLNGIRVSDMESLRSAIAKISVGDITNITIARGVNTYKLGPLSMGTK